eukprot:scaffold145650_cov36-Tisochrysis_lutea.AAC.2
MKAADRLSQSCAHGPTWAALANHLVCMLTQQQSASNPHAPGANRPLRAICVRQPRNRRLPVPLVANMHSLQSE